VIGAVGLSVTKHVEVEAKVEADLLRLVQHTEEEDAKRTHLKQEDAILNLVLWIVSCLAGLVGHHVTHHVMEENKPVVEVF